MVTKGKTIRTKKPSRKSKKFSFSLGKLRDSLLRKYKDTTKVYRTVAAILIVLIAIFLIFWTNKGLFLAANVNGRLITTPEFYKHLAKANGEQALDILTREILVKQEARKKSISVKDGEIGKKLEEIEKRLGGRQALEEAVLQNNTTIEEVRRQIEIQLLVEKLLADKIAVSDEDLDKYIAENKEATKELSREEVRDSLESQKLDEAFTPWFEDLRSKAKITRYF